MLLKRTSRNLEGRKTAAPAGRIPACKRISFRRQTGIPPETPDDRLSAASCASDGPPGFAHVARIVQAGDFLVDDMLAAAVQFAHAPQANRDQRAAISLLRAPWVAYFFRRRHPPIHPRLRVCLSSLRKSGNTKILIIFMFFKHSICYLF